MWRRNPRTRAKPGPRAHPRRSLKSFPVVPGDQVYFRTADVLPSLRNRSAAEGSSQGPLEADRGVQIRAHVRQETDARDAGARAWAASARGLNRQRGERWIGGRGVFAGSARSRPRRSNPRARASRNGRARCRGPGVGGVGAGAEPATRGALDRRPRGLGRVRSKQTAAFKFARTCVKKWTRAMPGPGRGRRRRGGLNRQRGERWIGGRGVFAGSARSRPRRSNPRARASRNGRARCRGPGVGGVGAGAEPATRGALDRRPRGLRSVRSKRTAAFKFARTCVKKWTRAMPGPGRGRRRRGG
jgi:hypothetical protein